MKYSITLKLTHDFVIDTKGLIKWADENLSLKLEQYTDQWIAFYKEDSITPTEEEGYKSQEQFDIEEYYLSLTEEGEDIKLALPSRLEGKELKDWEDSKKTEIASITNFASLSAVQKKLWMGLQLTDEEKDELGV